MPDEGRRSRRRDRLLSFPYLRFGNTHSYKPSNYTTHYENCPVYMVDVRKGCLKRSYQAACDKADPESFHGLPSIQPASKQQATNTASVIHVSRVHL